MPVAGFPLASPALGTAAEFALVAGLLAPGVELVGGVGETEGVVLWLWFGLADRIGGAVDA
jgi:Flp pilus assembly pilin Flp